MEDSNDNQIVDPYYQVRKFCNQHSTKKIEFFPAFDYNLYQTRDIDVYDFVSPNCDLILFDSTYIANSAEECYSWVKSLKLQHDFAFVTSTFSYHDSPDPNIIYFPFYYFQSLDNPAMKSYNIKDFRPYPLQCLNLNPWLHRTVNMIHMSQKSWFDQTLSSFHWLNPPNSDVPPTGIVEYVLSQLSDEEKTILNKLPLPLTINLPNEPDLAGWTYISNASRAHELSCIDYVIESGLIEKFVSEKIWKPFFSGQLFLCLGPCGIIQHLHDLGLDTFNDIIDHQKYDSIQGSSIADIRNKVGAILDLADNLLSSDLRKIWSETHERRNNNLQLVLSEEFQNKLLAKLIKKIA